MSGRLVIDFAPAEGAVLRMLGVIERRGFELRGIAMAEKGGQGSLLVDVAARDPGRRLEVVAGQLRRLIEVQTVSYSTPEQGLPA